MTLVVEQLEVWDDLAVLNGQRVALFLEPLSGDMQFADDQEERVTLKVPRTDPAYATVALAAILRTAYVGGVFRDWRISSLDEQADQSGATATITASDLLLDLADLPPIRSVRGGLVRFSDRRTRLTAAQYLADVLLPHLGAVGAAHWQVAVDPSLADVRFDYAWQNVSPLAWLRGLADAAGTAASARFMLRTAGTTVALVRVDDTPGEITGGVLELGAGLTAVRRKIRRADQATAVTAIGGDGRTIADNCWTVLAVAGGQVTVGPDENGGAAPVAFTGQLNGLALLRPDGTAARITGSAVGVGTSTLVLDNASGFTVGQRVRVAADPLGTQLTVLVHPGHVRARAQGGSGVAHRFLSLQNGAGLLNVAPNGLLADWPDAQTLPTGWLPYDTAERTPAYYTAHPTYRPTYAKNLDATKQPRGKPNLRMTLPLGSNTVGANTLPDLNGQGVRIPLSFRLIPVPGRSRVAARVRVQVENDVTPSTAYVRVRLTGPGIKGGLPGYPDVGTVEAAVDVGRVWIDAVLTAELLSAGPLYLDIVAVSRYGVVNNAVKYANPVEQFPGGLSVLVDGVAAVWDDQAPDDLFAGSLANGLWQDTNRYLAQYAPPPTDVEVDLLDLANVDPVRYGHLAVGLGETLAVVDPVDGARTPLRVQGYRPDLLVPGKAAVTATSRPRTFTSTLNKLTAATGDVAPNTDATAQVVAAFGTALRRKPTLTEVRGETATEGRLTLLVDDPDGTLVDVTLGTQSGGNAPVIRPPQRLGPYTATVPLVEKRESRISYQVRAALVPGAVVVVADEIIVYRTGNRPGAPDISATVDALGRVSVTSVGDSDTTSHRLLVTTGAAVPDQASLDAAPSLPGRTVTAQYLATVPFGTPFIVAARAYNAQGDGSEIGVWGDQRVAFSPATPLYAPPTGYADVVIVPFTYDVNTVRIAVYVGEFYVDPGAPISQEVSGWEPPYTPVERGDSQSLIVVPIARSHHWVLVTCVAYDQLGRRGSVQTFKCQGNSTPQDVSPNTVLGPVNLTATPNEISFDVQMPASNLPASLRLYANGSYVAEVARAAAAGDYQRLTVTGLQPGTTYAIQVRSVSANGAEVNPGLSFNQATPIPQLGSFGGTYDWYEDTSSGVASWGLGDGSVDGETYYQVVNQGSYVYQGYARQASWGLIGGPNDPITITASRPGYQSVTVSIPVNYHPAGALVLGPFDGSYKQYRKQKATYDQQEFGEVAWAAPGNAPADTTYRVVHVPTGSQWYGPGTGRYYYDETVARTAGDVQIIAERAGYQSSTLTLSPQVVYLTPPPAAAPLSSGSSPERL